MFPRERVLQLVLPTLLLWLAACAGGGCTRANGEKPALERLRARVIKRHPHDARAFTQGLEWHRGRLYESTGLHGQSRVRRIVLDTGTVELEGALPTELFGEGVTRVGQQLVQLTWKNGRALVWDLMTLKPVREFTYEGEGWGLCFDGKRLVMSDGTDKLTFRDPATFAVQGSVTVTREGSSLGHLNELECVDGDVFANVWQTEAIARIDADTGVVTGWIDASGLLAPAERPGTDVLNGIAFVPETERFLITGKNWPYLFEVEWTQAP